MTPDLYDFDSKDPGTGGWGLLLLIMDDSGRPEVLPDFDTDELFDDKDNEEFTAAVAEAERLTVGIRNAGCTTLPCAVTWLKGNGYQLEPTKGESC